MSKILIARFSNPKADRGEKHDTVTIRTVIHLDIPYSPEAYLQETGRAGRDGNPVKATLLYSVEDLAFADLLSCTPGNSAADSHDLPDTETADPFAVERYSQMLGYALDASRCRREQLLGFLGQELVTCGGCDVCDGRVQRKAEGQGLIIDFVTRNRRRFTMLQAVQVLRGARSYEVVRRGLALHFGFGSLASWQEEEIEEALESLRRSGKIKVLKRGFWRDRIAPSKHA